MKNTWKKLFFLLLGLNIVFLVFMIMMAVLPIKEAPLPLEGKEQNGEHVGFQIQTNKSDLNKVINHYLEKEGLKKQTDYKIILQDAVQLYGTVKVFNQDVEVEVSFEPEALDNGDLILRQESLSLGRLRLPASYVLTFVRDQYKLPDWVTIMPEENLVYLSLQNLKLNGDIQVSLDQFDLEKDDIRFTLFVPAE